MSGELRHLRRLSTIRSGKNIKFLSPAVYSGGWCPMRTACGICEGIEGLSYLIIGMPECATHSRAMNALPEGKLGELRWLYTLDANEVIFGARKGIIDALRVMDAEGPEAILMIATCVTDLIGEDFEGLIEEAQPELKARLSFVTLGQFKNFSSQIGTWKTAEALGSLMSPKPKTEAQANALFVTYWRNLNTPVEFPLIVGALEERGIKVRRVAPGANLGDYLDAPDAQLNLSLSSYNQPLAAKMEAAFGIPYAPLHRAFTVSDVDRVYDEITQALGIDLSGAFDKWRDKALELEDRARKELKGLKFASLTGVDMPVAMSLYLADLGMEPQIIHIQDFHNEDLEYAIQLKALGYDPPACRMMHRDRDIEIIRRLKPDICFGYKPDNADDLRFAEYMNDFFGMTGYERTVGLLTRIFNVLETGKNGERMDIYGPAPF